MHKPISTYLLPFLLVAVVWTGCSVIDGGTTTNAFLIKVDSLSIPSEVAASDTLIIQPYGTVGPNGCHSFSWFRAFRTSSSLDLQIIGKVVEGKNIGCTDAIVTLDTTYSVLPPLKGSFEINIQQPDGSVLTRTVEVEE